jgi:tRNA threonylcarbamoyl adenosine modification protein (Sua5/YciO/YrdC/YwlC family)
MSQYFLIHPQNPQARLIHQAVTILSNGGVIAYPTDSTYALGCILGNTDAQKRIRDIRGVDDSHHFTLVCRNLTEIGNYAQLNNSQFRLLKANTPGQYTFLLKATREVPRRLQHPKRSTIGLRIPQHAVTQAILEELNQPLLSMTLSIKDQSGDLTEAWQIRDVLEHQLDLVIDAGACLSTPTTVIDLTADEPKLIRAGAGALSPFGLTE